TDNDCNIEDSTWTPDDLRTSVAEATLLHFTGEYIEWMQDRTGGQLLPRDLDEVSFGCILLCEEYGDQFSPAAAMAIYNCRSVAAESGGIQWMDVLPWDLAMESLSTQTSDPTRGTESLVANLTHHSSGIRAFVFDLAWFVRDRLPGDEAAERLLRNTADTLVHWNSSLGLCYLLFPDEETFWAFADDYQPEATFEEQYRARLAAIKEHGLPNCTYYFSDLEADVRKRICEFALRLKCD
ncbi:MAG: hypothetical protein M1133_07110, partial [Armatimonadetes bacterium]|nr:hypothetical protein [Armatimonadota bacterium]